MKRSLKTFIATDAVTYQTGRERTPLPMTLKTLTITASEFHKLREAAKAKGLLAKFTDWQRNKHIVIIGGTDD